MTHLAAAHPETIKVVQTVHDTVRDTIVRVVAAHRLGSSEVAQIILGIAAIFATVVFGLPAFWQWIENGLPPKVTTRVDLGAEEMVAPEGHNHWGRDLNKQYAVIRVQNRRGVQFSITGGRLDSSTPQHEVWFQAPNTPRVLEPKEATHYHLEMEQIGDPKRATFTLMSYGWQKTYSFGA